MPQPHYPILVLLMVLAACLLLWIRPARRRLGQLGARLLGRRRFAIQGLLGLLLALVLLFLLPGLRWLLDLEGGGRTAILLLLVANFVLILVPGLLTSLDEGDEACG